MTGERPEQQEDAPDPRQPEKPERIRTSAALAALGRALLADSRLLAARARPVLRRLALHLGAVRSRAGGRLRGLLSRPRPPAPGATGEAPTPRRRSRPVRPLWRRALRGVVALTAVLVLAVTGLLVWALWGMEFSALARAESEPTVVIEALDGEMFATKGPFRGPPVERKALPDHLVDAVISIEDRRFYQHPGLDPVGILRAAMTNAASGGIVEGGSTITQQLARVLFLSQDRTLRRKLREAALAVWLERTFSKDEILGRYLANIYMGAGVYGMPAAAQVYFGKRIEELSLAESAMLAGLIKAPSDLNPRTDLDAARERAAVVLDAMVATGAIGPGEAAAARASPAELRSATVTGKSGGWFADWVYQEAADLAGSFNGALYVRSTLHPRVQRLAEQAVAAVMDSEGAEKEAGEAALVAMLPDGAVLALVGGRDYEASQFNRATEALRQPGSTFKIFVYYAALRQGYSMRDRIRYEPVEIDGWRPENYGGRYRGRVRLSQALAQSLNVATVRLAQQVGVERVVEAARELGIDADLEPSPSLALGTSEVTLLDLIGAYASLVEGRTPVEPWGIVNFGTDSDTRYSLGQRTPPRRELGPERGELIEALRLAVEEGTGRAARLDGFAAGKTGTTQDHRDAWFVGFNGPFVAGVWVGNDDNSPMKGVTGGDLPARIWRRFMTDLMAMLAEGDPILKPVGDWGGEGAAARATSRARQGAEAPLQCNVRACERAYRSFRRSDCTFQPYSGPRKRCAK